MCHLSLFLFLHSLYLPSSISFFSLLFCFSFSLSHHFCSVKIRVVDRGLLGILSNGFQGLTVGWKRECVHSCCCSFAILYDYAFILKILRDCRNTFSVTETKTAKERDKIHERVYICLSPDTYMSGTWKWHI